MAGMTISPSLFAHLTHCLRMGLEEQLPSPNRRARQGINAMCDTGFVAPLLAIAAWEALLHELLLSDFPRMVHHKNPLWKIPLEIIDHLKIKDKTLIVPDFLFGVTFDKGAQPYQDFSVLLQVRNRFVHFKNETEMPIKNVSKYLGDKGLLMEAPKPQDVPDGIECDYPWPAKFACTEMVRWAINTVAAMAAKLESFIPEKDSHAVGLCQNFRRVDELWVRSWYASHSIIIDRN